jgi:hypothetical protein
LCPGSGLLESSGRSQLRDPQHGLVEGVPDCNFRVRYFLVEGKKFQIFVVCFCAEYFGPGYFVCAVSLLGS